MTRKKGLKKDWTRQRQCLKGPRGSSSLVTRRNMDDVECGQVLLSEANSSLAENMAKLAAVNEELQKL